MTKSKFDVWRSSKASYIAALQRSRYRPTKARNERNCKYILLPAGGWMAYHPQADVIVLDTDHMQWRLESCGTVTNASVCENGSWPQTSSKMMPIWPE